MLEIIEGDKDDIREEMVEARISYVKQVDKYKRKYRVHKDRALAPAYDYPREVQQDIKRLEKLIHFHRVTYYLPVRIGGYVLNYFTLSKFLWRVRDHGVQIREDDGMLTLLYGKPGQPLESRLQLYDLSQHYKELVRIPTAILVDRREGRK